MTVSGPDGQFGWLQISCPEGRAKCRQLAAESCPDGYDVEDFRFNGSRYGTTGGLDEQIGPPGRDKQLLVQCRAAPTRVDPAMVPH